MPPGIRCPECLDDSKVGVTDSRPVPGARYRRYVCERGHRFSTTEFVRVGKGPQVVDPAADPPVMSVKAWLDRRVGRAILSLKECFK